MKLIGTVLGLSALALSTQAQASWLSKITGIHINPSAGHFYVEKPQPQAIPEMLQNLPKDLAQMVLNPNGAMLAEAIRISRNTNIGGASPVPPMIRAQLAPYFPAQILDNARFRVKSNAISLPSIINVINKGNAVTLNDLIVFDNGSQAANLELWAHELTHYVQYRNMGVESFANVYSIGGGIELEKQARENAANIMKAINHSFATAPSFQYAANAFTAPISPAEFLQPGKAFVDPKFCIKANLRPDGAQIANGCIVPVAITAFQMATPMGPQQFPCTFNCVIQPNSYLNFNTPAPPIGFFYQF